MWKKLILHIKKPIFILVEWETEKTFFEELKSKFNLWNIKVFVKSKRFFQKIKETNKSWFFKLIWKQRQETKYQDKWNIVYIIFDLEDEYAKNLDILENNIKLFSKSKFIKWDKEIKWEIKYFYSNPCFEKLLFILGWEESCLENTSCKELKIKFYWKNRTNLQKIEQIFKNLTKNEIIDIINNYTKKCKVDDKDILFLIKSLVI